MTNPLFHPSDLPFSLPDFSVITPAVVREALETGMEQEANQWQEIATNPEPADVTNTVVATDAAGPILTRAEAVFSVMLSSVGGAEWQALYEELAPKFSAHSDRFWLDKRLYERFTAVSKRDDLDEETRHFVDEMIGDFKRQGVDLSAADQALLRDYNATIAALQAQIDTKITKQLNRTGTTGTDLDDLDGLDEQQLQEAIKSAEAPDVWRLPVANYSQPPLIGSLAKHEVRGRALADSLQRGLGADPECDTRSEIIELARLRARRAELLGFPSHAWLTMDDQTVPDPDAAQGLLETVGTAAKVQLETERVRYEEAAKSDGHALGPEDWVYFEERQRGTELGIDPAALKEYFELSRVVEDGLFFAANRLFGLTFRPRPDIRGWTEDVQVWEAMDEDGLARGLFLADYYQRPGKSGGAWMGEIQSGSGRAGCLPIVTNDANFQKPPAGQPTLLTWDEVETCFHEFGHALHGLLTRTYYSSTAGTSVPSDFVELPSQLNEMWAYHPEVLSQYARHYQTGEPLPEQVAEKLSKSKHFGQAFATLEYVQAALLDQYWHKPIASLPDSANAVEAFEVDSLNDSGVDHDLVVPRYRSAYFAHTFAGGYDGAYYSYMWAEAMVGELEEWFAEQAELGADGTEDGGFNREAGRQLEEELLSRGSSRDPLTSFRALRGRDPQGEAVNRRRGLA